MSRIQASKIESVFNTFQVNNLLEFKRVIDILGRYPPDGVIKVRIVGLIF